MAFSLVQAWATNRVTSGTTAAVVLGSVPLAGDLLVATYSVDNGLTATIADSIGDGVPWSTPAPLNGIGSSINVGRKYVSYKIVGTPSGGAKTVTVTASGTISLGMGVSVAEYAATGAISLDGTPAVATAQSAAQSPGTITTTSTAGLVIGCNEDNAAYTTPAGGFTQRSGTPDVLTWKASVEDKITTAGGVYDASWTGGASDFWISMVIGFKQAVASASGPSSWLKYLMLLGIFSGSLFTVASGVILLNWTAPLTMGDGSAVAGITGYNIYRSLIPFDIAPSLAASVGNVLTATLTAVPPGTWYVWISAVTAAGESPLVLAFNAATNTPYWVI